MPDAEECARDCCCRAEVEECKGGRKSRVLHTHLDGDRLDLCHVHVQCLCNEKAECVAEQVVTHDDNHDECARLDDTGCVCRDNAAHDEDDGNDGDEWEDLDRLLDGTLEEVVDEYDGSYGLGKNGNRWERAG